jgi:hypothetical protein
MEVAMWVAIIIAVLMFAGIGVHELSHKNDTPAEQAIEAILKIEGVDIDFSADDKHVDQPAPE